MTHTLSGCNVSVAQHFTHRLPCCPAKSLIIVCPSKSKGQNKLCHVYPPNVQIGFPPHRFSKMNTILCNTLWAYNNWFVIFSFCLFLSFLSEPWCVTNKMICQESCSSRLLTVSLRNTEWMRAGTAETAVTVAERLSLPARCRPSARCLSCSPNLRLSAGRCTTLTLKRGLWKTVNIVSAFSRSDSHTTDLARQENILTVTAFCFCTLDLLKYSQGFPTF